MIQEKYNTIRFKLSFIVGILTLVYTIILVGYFNFKYKKTLVEDASEKSDVWAQKYAGEIKANIELALDVSRTTAHIFSSQVNVENQVALNRNEASAFIRNLVEKNDFLLGMYTAWEPNMFDGVDDEYAGQPDNHPNGHFVPYWYKKSDNSIGFEPLKYYLHPEKGSYYLGPRQTKRETIIDPISYKIGDRQVLLITLVVPILTKNNSFVGIVGTDISTESIQKLVDASNLFNGNGELSIVSNNGTIVAVSGKKELIGKNVNETFPQLSTRFAYNELNRQVFTQNDTLHTIVPVNFGASTTPWYIMIKVPFNYLTQGLVIDLLKLTFFGIVFLGFLIFATSWFIHKFLNPIKKITKVAQKVATGDLNVWDVEANSSEINELNGAFKQVIDSQKQITSVTESIAKGDYSKYAKVKSENDQLAISVNQMIDFLKTSTEEDKKRQWGNEGYAHFMDILRNDGEIKNLSQSALNYLIKYLNMNQGGVFLINESDENHKYLELMAAYAFGRVKYLDKQIRIGEGLVGQAYLERQTIFLTEIPDEFVNIRSGLGDSAPRCIIIVPFSHNEKIEGVFEFASFKKLQKFEIEFLEKCAQSFASVVANSRINEFTTKLLGEAQEKTEQMKMQEEEMRQNMEEMSATQEELHRKTLEIEQIRNQEREELVALREKEKILIEKIKVLEQNQTSPNDNR
jgi:methyl-accepting chemotaxis protein